MEGYSVLITIGVAVFVILGSLLLVTRFYKQVEQGKAIIINTLRAEPIVTFTGSIVLPVIHRAETMDLSVKTIEIDRRGKEGLICMDNIRADINVTFFVRVNKTTQSVLQVAQSIGTARASDPRTLSELFTAKFAEALKTAGKRFNFADLYSSRLEFRDKIVEAIDTNLNGFVLDDVAIDYLEQTPLSALDANNIMDAEGIKKITELTVIQNVMTNELRQKEKMEIGSQNLTSKEALFRFEQREKEAEAKKDKEVVAAQARESEEGKRIALEEANRTLILQKQKEQESEIAEQVKMRAIGVADRNKQKELVRETEGVEQSRAEAQVARERVIANAVLAKDREIEEKKKEIATVIAGRVSVEKSIAVEEEATKDIRVVAEANRARDAVRIGAEGEAQKDMIKRVKAAEAGEESAKHEARQRLVLADADLEAADRTARSKIRLAEGIQAEEAARGLADVRVREAQATVSEKQGLIDAHVSLEKGKAEAGAMREKMVAEASGIKEKADSMKQFDEATRGHEEFRLRLDKERAVELATIANRVQIAQAQAEVMGKAMTNAKVQIVGGDGQFFERFVKALSLGQQVETAIETSPTLNTLAMDAMTRPAGDDSIKSLITQLGGGEGVREKLAELVARQKAKGERPGT